MESIDLTIIVPVYNASRYLRECLDSILIQTYKDWECVVVNDGSTDDSQVIIDEYCAKDYRFSCLIKGNERSAAKAREYGMAHTQSKWVAFIDADDVIAPNFYERIIKRQQETNAEVVTGYLIKCKNELDGEDWRLPHKDFDMTQILSGRECCLMTIGGWNIGGMGIALRSLYNGLSGGSYMNSDEYLSRAFLLQVKIHAFADAKYYYRNNIGTSDSISVRMFDRTLVDMQLEQFVYDNFSEREDKINALAWQRLFNLIYLTADYNIHKKEFTKEEQEKAYKILRKSYKALNRKTARKVAPIQSLMLTHSFTLFSLLATIYVKYKRSQGGKFYYR